MLLNHQLRSLQHLLYKRKQSNVHVQRLMHPTLPTIRVNANVVLVTERNNFMQLRVKVFYLSIQQLLRRLRQILHPSWTNLAQMSVKVANRVF